MDTLSLDDLQRLYPPARERALKKQLDHLDVHAQRFIALSPYAVLSSAGADGALDASPRGGAPGFVQVVDAHTLLIPDSPGNNRLDTLQQHGMPHGRRWACCSWCRGWTKRCALTAAAVLSVDERRAAEPLPRRAPRARRW